VDGVDSAARAGVLAGRATEGGGALRWGVVDGVTWFCATPLEDVVETDPVAYFVGAEGREEKEVSSSADSLAELDHLRSATEIVGGEGPAGQGAAINHDTVELRVGSVF
jgi:hypothetical protein